MVGKRDQRQKELVSIVTDDPCDSLPESLCNWYWQRVRLDREADPTIRAAIKYGFNSQYGRFSKSQLLQAVRFVCAGDPCDEWPVLYRWNVLTFSDEYEPPENLGRFNGCGEYVIWENPKV